MTRFIGLIFSFLLTLAGCADAGISVASVDDLGLQGAPSGRSIVSAGGSAGKMSSESFSGFVNIGSCDVTSGAVAQGGQFEMSDPLLEVVSQ